MRVWFIMLKISHFSSVVTLLLSVRQLEAVPEVEGWIFFASNQKGSQAALDAPLWRI